MGLSTPRTVFGIHSICPVSRTDGMPYGPVAKVLKSSNFSLVGETVDLFGGSSPYSWQTENGTITAELSLTMNEYPSWVFELFLGQALTENAAETTGNVTTGTNVLGSSIISAANGIEVTATGSDEADLKFGKYIIKAVSANTFDVYGTSDLDYGSEVFVNDALKINS